MTNQTDADSEDENEPEERAWYNQRRSFRYKVVYQLSKITMGRVKSPYIRSIKNFHLGRDAEDNAESRPTDEQHLTTWVIWAVESYTPANINSLLDGLEKLRPVRQGPDRDPALWLRRNRYNPGSSLELYLQKPGLRPIMGFDLDLPNFAEYGAGTIWTATSSLTLLTMMFVLTEAEQSRFETRLKEDHPTRIEATSFHGAMVFSPELERRRAVSEARLDWSHQVSNWFGEHFPGLFCMATNLFPHASLQPQRALFPFLAGGTIQETRRSSRHSIGTAPTPSFSAGQATKGCFTHLSRAMMIARRGTPSWQQLARHSNDRIRVDGETVKIGSYTLLIARSDPSSPNGLSRTC